MEPKFKVGTWIFCEFELQQVTGTEGNKITSVTSGQFSLCSSDLSDRCFEINTRTKLASDYCKYWYRQFHDIKGANSINHPDLNRVLVGKWVAICEELNDDKRKILYEKLDEFGRSVINKVKETITQEVEGVPIFR